MQLTNITGQQRTKSRLICSVLESRVSHAQLFHGPEGCGKLALAIAYAQYINCTARTENDSCGTCPSCRKYNKLIHPDLHFIFPVAATKNVPKNPLSRDFLKEWRELLIDHEYYINLNDWYNKIEIENKQGIINAEDCNEIIKTLNYKSYESEYKVMIIWMVEKLFHAAAPKILKILEEPPDKTLFILISDSPGQIIPTILSRTQLVKIPRLSDKDIVDTLREKFKIHAAEANNIANISSGNLLMARNLVNRSEVTNEMFTLFSQWMRLAYQGRVQEIVNFNEDLIRMGREKQKAFLSYSLWFIRECMLLYYGTHNLVKLNSEEQQFARNFAPFIHNKNGEQIYEELNNALYYIERNANPSLLFLDICLTINNLLKIRKAG